jgi:hypothetical protein
MSYFFQPLEPDFLNIFWILYENSTTNRKQCYNKNWGLGVPSQDQPSPAHIFVYFVYLCCYNCVLHKKIYIYLFKYKKEKRRNDISISISIFIGCILFYQGFGAMTRGSPNIHCPYKIYCLFAAQFLLNMFSYLDRCWDAQFGMILITIYMMLMNIMNRFGTVLCDFNTSLQIHDVCKLHVFHVMVLTCHSNCFIVDNLKISHQKIIVASQFYSILKALSNGTVFIRIGHSLTKLWCLEIRYLTCLVITCYLHWFTCLYHKN